MNAKGHEWDSTWNQRPDAREPRIEDGSRNGSSAERGVRNSEWLMERGNVRTQPPLASFGFRKFRMMNVEAWMSEKERPGQGSTESRPTVRAPGGGLGDGGSSHISLIRDSQFVIRHLHDSKPGTRRTVTTTGMSRRFDARTLSRLLLGGSKTRSASFSS